jgi:etoposide-induced 2.4 mRNA
LKQFVLIDLFLDSYRWINDGHSLRRRIGFVEKYWPYFMGYGTPYVLVYFFFPYFISVGVGALFFPFVSGLPLT